MAGDARFRRRLWEEPYSEIAKIYGAARSDKVREQLTQAYLQYHHHPTKLVRDLEGHLQTGRRDIAIEGVFAQAILNSKEVKENYDSVGVRGLEEILNIAKKGKSSWEEARTKWLQDENQPSRVKAHYLLAHLNEPWVERMWQGGEGLPKEQVSKIREEIEKESDYFLFYELARQHPERERAPLVSFEYQRFRFPKGGQKMVLGSPSSEEGRWGSDENEREMTFEKGFQMARTEVTVLKYLLGTKGSFSNYREHLPGESQTQEELEHPVANINWHDAVKYTENLSAAEKARGGKRRYDLPSEARWEFAARGGTRSRYSFGEGKRRLGEYGWFNLNGEGRTHPVGKLRPGPYGLYDMHGNVWEWNADGWEADVSKHGKRDWEADRSGSNRVVRGGGWSSDPRGLRSSYRNRSDPASAFDPLGFRLWRTP